MNKYTGYIVGAISIIVFFASLYFSNIGLFFIGIFLLLCAIFITIIYMVTDLYKKDKEIDLELIKKLNLTIVECVECHKENVLEDIYCIHCGEKLEE